MDALQFIALILSMVALFAWNIAESRENTILMDSNLDCIRELVRSIHDEVKDLHAKLLSIEKERGKK